MGMEGVNETPDFKWEKPWEQEGAREVKEEELETLSEEDKARVEVHTEGGETHWYIPTKESGKESREGSVISPELQKHIDKVIGKGQEPKINLMAMNERLKAVPSEMREGVLQDEEVKTFVKEYVTAKSQDGKIGLSAFVARMESVPAEIKDEILHSEEVTQFLVDKVIGKGQEPKINKMAAQARLDQIPEEIRSDISNHLDVQTAFPGLGK